MILLDRTKYFNFVDIQQKNQIEYKDRFIDPKFIFFNLLLTH